MLRVLKIEGSINEKDLIGFDGNCVTQILGELPSEALLRQACFFFFRYLEKRKIRNPSLFFLTLLAATDQIDEALSKYGQRRRYIIKCCKDSWEFPPTLIKNWEERIALSTNAIISIE